MVIKYGYTEEVCILNYKDGKFISDKNFTNEILFNTKREAITKFNNRVNNLWSYSDSDFRYENLASISFETDLGDGFTSFTEIILRIIL